MTDKRRGALLSGGVGKNFGNLISAGKEKIGGGLDKEKVWYFTNAVHFITYQLKLELNCNQFGRL